MTPAVPTQVAATVDGSGGGRNAAAFLRRLAAAHGGGLGAATLRGVGEALGDHAVGLLNARGADRCARLAACERLLEVFADVAARVARDAAAKTALGELVARLVQDFDHAPLPRAFLVERFLGEA